MTILKEDISKRIWDSKYRYRYRGTIIDQTLEDTWERVAIAVASAEKRTNRHHWQQQFLEILNNFRFLPGGRILAGAGTKHCVTLFNCFVIPVVEDSLEGIFTALKEGALTLQHGGGIGYDFSCLRPRGALVKKTDAQASGPVSYMRIWDSMCKVMVSSGSRRGAMMGVLHCSHPDIEEFIEAKADRSQLRHFNVSVLVSDAFMMAVKNNDDWPLLFPIATENLSQCKPSNGIIMQPWLSHRKPIPCQVYRYVKARKLWERIIKAAYGYSEPGVLFEDTINRMNNLWYREWIHATNPCGEIPLPDYASCNLGSINLTQFVRNSFEAKAELDWQGIEKTVQVASRFLDNVIDISRYPLSPQRKEARATRRIGLGICGLADTFVMLGIRYGSKESIALARQIMQLIAESSWSSSIALAKEKGVFPLCDTKRYLQGVFVKSLPPELRRDIKKFGIRNSHHNAIAPTGTISLLANNISSGIEPIFARQYERSIRLPNGEHENFQVVTYALRLWQQMHKTETLPSAWVDSGSLQPREHLLIQSAMQQHVDNAISKTINIPENFPFKALTRNIYECLCTWSQGLHYLSP